MQQIDCQANPAHTRSHQRHAWVVLTLALAQMVSACGGGGGVSPAPIPTPTPTPTPKAWQGAALIETDDTSGAGSARIAMDTSGNTIAVWLQSNGTRDSVWANRYDASAAAWGTAKLLETSDTDDVYEPQVAVDANSNAMAVWLQFDGMQTSIWATRYTPSTGWGTPTLVDSESGNADGVQIAMDDIGNAIAAWQQIDGSLVKLRSNRYTGSTGWGTATAVIDNGNAVPFMPQIAVDASGNAIAVWRQFDGENRDIVANRYTVGSGWGTAGLIETTNEIADVPEIAMDASGNAMAVWQQFDGTHFDIWANRYTASTGWGTATLVETSKGSASLPQIALDASGNAMAVWQQSDGIQVNIWANRYNASTSAWGTPVLVEADNVGNAREPQIAMDANGNAIAVWSQFDGALLNSWTNRYTSGVGWGAPVLLETNQAGDAFKPQIAMNASGNAVAVWRQLGNAISSIWANVFR